MPKSQRNFSEPNDSSARLFAILVGTSLAVVMVSTLNHSETLVGQINERNAAFFSSSQKSEVTQNAESTTVTSTDNTPTAQADTAPTTAASSRAYSSMKAASSKAAASTATIEQRVESREGGMNAAEDYSDGSDVCPRNSLGNCITTEEEVLQIAVYKSCYYKGAFGKFPRCGIDQPATDREQAAAREYLRSRPQPVCLDKDGKPTTDRTKCAPPTPEQPKPEEERQVLEKIEDLFLGNRKEEDRRALNDALGTANARVQKLLVSKVYKFSDSDKKNLATQVSWIQQQLKRFDGKTSFNETDIQAARKSLAASLQDIQGMVTVQKRQLAEQAPRLENIVTRIDDLVTRVGTVLRELERDGTKVPAEVTEGYLTAKIYLTDAKTQCSMRRPTSCGLLGQALDEIAKMQKPLCALPSDRLTFCN